MDALAKQLPDIELESVPCDLCGASIQTQNLVVESSDHAHGVVGVFQVVRCAECGLHFLNPRPTPAVIGQCYPNDYYAYGANEGGSLSPSIKNRLRRVIRRSRLLSVVFRHIPAFKHAAIDVSLADDLPQWQKPGRVLDIGCGAGAFLDGLRDNGWQTYGVEPSEPASKAARAHGHHVLCQSATDPFPEEWIGSFDIVQLSHSLEHVHSPSVALQEIRKVLKKDTGRLIVEVPNLESLLTYWYGELGLVFDTPRHLYMFSPDTLSKLLEKAGFKLMSLRHLSRPMHFVRCFGLLSGQQKNSEWQTKSNTALQDPALLHRFEALATFAAERQMGGEIRVVAACR